MSFPAPTVTRTGFSFPSTVLRRFEDYGIWSLDLVSPPRRFWGDGETPPPAVEAGVDARRTQPLPTPASLLTTLPEGDNWQAQSRRSLGRLWAHYLLAEDPQRRLDARSVSTLAHQVSLVQHVLGSDVLGRVLIADEVGLGKTVEAGLIVQQLLERNPGLRILYLAPARLVSNVLQEFDRLGLAFRQWSAGGGDARLTDPRVVASIHRAVHELHFSRVANSPMWDVLIVDECHHLSDWAPGGGDPKQKFRLVRDLIARQRPEGRVLFLSGTPHQGHVNRFENLLGLLRRDGEPEEALGGRVIYRTKEDVSDWDGRPLFPKREIREPLILDLGATYREWIGAIHEFYRPRPDAPKSGRQRAAGWRCAQALQWAASSPQAGLGYLVRQAVRARWELRSGPLADAVAALRPYRAGPADEPVDLLFERIHVEVARQRRDDDLDDIEDDNDEAAGAQERIALEGLLTHGLAVLAEEGDAKWRFLERRVLADAGAEKVVLFAQPLETVTALARYLERQTGEKPAIIVGGQSDAERRREVDRFRDGRGPRYLVSSRAGGEGINLQVARRLVHVDVPWNPMELEQRVGRVHRFGSRRTILVDTVVVRDSREADAYRIARRRLREIARTLVEPRRFEEIFSRVMTLLPPEELQDVLLNGPLAPLSTDDQNRIGALVRAGFRAWNEFHRRYAEQQRRIGQQAPGLASWEDVVRFLKAYAGAAPAEGFTAHGFTQREGDVEPTAEPATVLDLGGSYYSWGDRGGAIVAGPKGEVPSPLGLNLPAVAAALRRAAFPSLPTGAAHLRWPRDRATPAGVSLPFGVLVFFRQTVGPDSLAGWAERACALPCYVVGDRLVPVDSENKRVLFSGLVEASLRAKPDPDTALSDRLKSLEETLTNELRQPSDDELALGIRHAVAPLLASRVSADR